MKQKKSKKSSGSSKVQAVPDSLESGKFMGLPVGHDIQLPAERCSSSQKGDKNQELQFSKTCKSDNSSAGKCHNKNNCIEFDKGSDMPCDTRFKNACHQMSVQQSELAKKPSPSATIGGYQTQMDGFSQDMRSVRRTYNSAASAMPSSLLCDSREMWTKSYHSGWLAVGQPSHRTFAPKIVETGSTDLSEHNRPMSAIQGCTGVFINEDALLHNGEVKSHHLTHDRNSASICVADHSPSISSTALIENCNGDLVSKKKSKRGKNRQRSKDKQPLPAVSCSQDILIDKVPGILKITDCNTFPNLNYNNWKDESDNRKWKSSFQQVVNHHMPKAQSTGKGNYTCLDNGTKMDGSMNWHCLDHLPFQSSMLRTFCDFSDLANSSNKSLEKPLTLTHALPELSSGKVSLSPHLVASDGCANVDDNVSKKKKVPTATLR